MRTAAAHVLAVALDVVTTFIDLVRAAISAEGFSCETVSTHLLLPAMFRRLPMLRRLQGHGPQQAGAEPDEPAHDDDASPVGARLAEPAPCWSVLMSEHACWQGQKTTGSPAKSDKLLQRDACCAAHSQSLCCAIAQPCKGNMYSCMNFMRNPGQRQRKVDCPSASKTVVNVYRLSIVSFDITMRSQNAFLRE